MVSDEWCRLFGVERDDAPHRHAQVQARVHPDDRAARDAALQEAMAKHGGLSRVVSRTAARRHRAADARAGPRAAPTTKATACG
ncbi:PAS domain-containing protein [Burkholderia vietnamiensis]|uniref:PAS domain-containing protein n=1 Tax=Burkholderia vietnamiensis TaxID=60552 RepID=UPI00207CB5F1|nr:PAS domain-containing protein [Burkholderia vietnamiensis]MCO1430226.1 PAS domain-containing protein [Burkholderia vietnamiensis]